MIISPIGLPSSSSRSFSELVISNWAVCPDCQLEARVDELIKLRVFPGGLRRLLSFNAAGVFERSIDMSNVGRLLLFWLLVGVSSR